MLDYKLFMMHPDATLLAASVELIDKLNNDPALLKSNGIDISNRIYEYMKAIMLISA